MHQVQTGSSPCTCLHYCVQPDLQDARVLCGGLETCGAWRCGAQENAVEKARSAGIAVLQCCVKSDTIPILVVGSRAVRKGPGPFLGSILVVVHALCLA